MIFMLSSIPLCIFLGPGQDLVQLQDRGDVKVESIHAAEVGHMTAGQEVAVEAVQGAGPGHIDHPGPTQGLLDHQSKIFKTTMLIECIELPNHRSKFLYNIDNVQETLQPIVDKG